MEDQEKNTFIDLIARMHLKFGITSRHMRWTDEEKDFRIVAMQEELDEYMDAETKEDELDALLDLVIFAMGTAERQGMLEVFEEGFRRVMRANCNKNVGKNAKRGNFQIDLVKPEHWKPPVLTDLVQANKQQELFGDKHGA
jgi:hypothetical protein